jgi:hypothetical protein
MLRRMSRWSWFAVLALTQGCLIVVGRNSSPRVLVPRSHVGSATDNHRTGNTVPFGPKAVVGKQEPNRLVARDGTSCAVSAQKFNSTVLGTTAWCPWTGTAR